MPNTSHYDAIVIGSGQAGTPLCTALAGAGLRTALIERQHVGGTCVNEGCTPTKTMVASGRVAYLARRGDDYGVLTGELSINMERVRERKRDIVASFRSGSQGRIEQTADLDLIFGEASFTGPKSINVRLKDGSQRSLTAERFFINAGARPSVPELAGLKDVPFLDSTSIMELGRVPEHLLVLGGGYVGLEFGQMFRRFGSRVTIVQSAKQLLSREDPDVAQEVAQILEQDGITILLNATATGVGQVAGEIRLEVRHQGQSVKVAGSHLLVATGRTPNSDTLNLPAAGVQTTAQGFIKANDRLETSARGH
jgi:pyruvate/2-oxoglutarate dehydrogenase complex dihydrolipoamide dehydrogenase (E3) component